MAIKITPLDIRKHEFSRAFRGFDPEEVESFLDVVASEFEALIASEGTLKEKVLKLETQLENFRRMEKTLQETIINAQQTMSQAKEGSKKEAQQIRRAAELEAEKMLIDAKNTLARLKDEQLLLKSQKTAFINKLKHVLTSQIELIEVLEKDDFGLK